MADRIARPVQHFLYGADLHPERLAACCPGAKVLAVAELKDHHLAFYGHNDLWDSGEETVLRAPGSSVFGVVVALSAREADFLDKVRGVRLNGTGSHFHSPARVTSGAEVFDVVLYKLDDGRQVSLPSADYLAYMVEGARHFGLPASHIAELQARASRPAGFAVPRIAFPAIVIAASGGCAC